MRLFKVKKRFDPNTGEELIPKLSPSKILLCDYTGEEIDLDTRVEVKYESITKASIETKIPISNISFVCLNKRKTAGGFGWKFDVE